MCCFADAALLACEWVVLNMTKKELARPPAAERLAERPTYRAALDWTLGAAMTWRDRLAKGSPITNEERYARDREQQNLLDAALALLTAAEKNRSGSRNPRKKA